MTISLEAARTAKEKVLKLVESQDHVSGVGIAKHADDYAVRINVDREPKEGNPFPEEIDGVPIIVRVVGAIRKSS